MDIFLFSLVSQLSDAVIKPEDYSIFRQLSPRLNLYARLIPENVSVFVTMLCVSCIGIL